jgi:hypothetical protein
MLPIKPVIQQTNYISIIMPELWKNPEDRQKKSNEIRQRNEGLDFEVG